MRHHGARRRTRAASTCSPWCLMDISSWPEPCAEAPVGLHAVHAGLETIRFPSIESLSPFVKTTRRSRHSPPRLQHPKPPNIQLHPPTLAISTNVNADQHRGMGGGFPHILNICDILKHWLVHRGNYQIIITIMTCSSYQMPGCLTAA